MQNFGYAALQIIPSMRGARGAIESELNGAAGGAGTQAGNTFGSRFLDGLKTWTKRGAIAIGAITTAVGAMAVKGGITRVLDTEDAIVQMRRMGLEVEQVDALIDGVDKTFDGTIFSNPQGFQLAGLLHGTNVELEKIPGVIGTISDFAAHGNVPLEQMGDIFLQVIGSGRVGADIFNRLTAAGVPIEQLAMSLGMTSGEMRELASSGGFTADMFLEATANAEMFQGAAKSAGDTTRGAFSNALTQVRVLGQQLVNPLFGENGPMVTFFQSVRSALIGIRPLFAAAGDAIGAVLVPALESAGEWFERLPELLEGLSAPDLSGLAGALQPVADVLSAIWSVIQPVAAAFMDALAPAFDEMGGSLGAVVSGLSPIGAVLTSLQPVLPTVTEALVAIAGALGGALAVVLPVVADLLSTVAGVIADVLVAVLPTVVDIVMVLADAFSEIVPVIADVAGIIVGALADGLGEVLPLLADLALSLVQALAPVLPTIVSALRMVATAFTGLLTVALQAVLPILIELVTVVVQALVPILPILGTLLQAVATVFMAVMQAVVPLLPPILGLIEMLAGALIPFLPALVDLIAVVATVFLDLVVALSPLLPTVANLVAVLLELALIVLTPLIDIIMLVANVVVTVLAVALDLLMPIVTGVIGIVTALAEVLTGMVAGAVQTVGGIFRTVWNAISSVTMAIWNGIRTVIVGVVGVISSTVRTVFSAVSGFISSVWRTVQTITTGAWQAVRNAVSNGVRNVVGFIRDLPNQARRALSNIGSTLLNAGRQLIQGFLDGITGAFQRVRDKLSELTSFLPDWKGPASRDRTILYNAGGLVIGGFVDGLDDGFGTVESALGGLTDMLEGYDMPTLTVGVDLDDDGFDPAALDRTMLRAPYLPPPPDTAVARAEEIDRGRRWHIEQLNTGANASEIFEELEWRERTAAP